MMSGFPLLRAALPKRAAHLLASRVRLAAPLRSLATKPPASGVSWVPPTHSKAAQEAPEEAPAVPPAFKKVNGIKVISTVNSAMPVASEAPKASKGRPKGLPKGIPEGAIPEGAIPEHILNHQISADDLDLDQGTIDAFFTEAGISKDDGILLRKEFPEGEWFEGTWDDDDDDDDDDDFDEDGKWSNAVDLGTEIIGDEEDFNGDFDDDFDDDLDEDLDFKPVDLGTEEVDLTKFRVVDNTTASWMAPTGVTSAPTTWNKSIPPPPPNDELLSAEYLHMYLEEHLKLNSVVSVPVPVSKSSGILSHFVIGSIPASSSNLPGAGRRCLAIARELVKDLCAARLNKNLSDSQGKKVYGEYFIEGGVDDAYNMGGDYYEDDYDGAYGEDEDEEDGVDVDDFVDPEDADGPRTKLFNSDINDVDDGWCIIDCGDVVVHIFEADKNTRAVANLEERWSREGHADDHEVERRANLKK
jgi:hypothetical protein